MYKQAAYNLGVQLAMYDAGIIKVAQSGVLRRLLSTIEGSPLASRALVGGGIGGVLGGEDDRLKGIALGTLAGAAAPKVMQMGRGLGRRLGERGVEAGKAGLSGSAGARDIAAREAKRTSSAFKATQTPSEVARMEKEVAERGSSAFSPESAKALRTQDLAEDSLQRLTNQLGVGRSELANAVMRRAELGRAGAGLGLGALGAGTLAAS